MQAVAGSRGDGFLPTIALAFSVVAAVGEPLAAEHCRVERPVAALRAALRPSCRDRSASRV